jgi:hypothetical protein
MGILDRFRKEENIHIERTGNDVRLSEKSTDELVREYKEQHPGLMSRIIEKKRQERDENRETYKKAYADARIEAVKARARHEANRKYRPTTHQRVNKILGDFEHFGEHAAGIRGKRPQSQKKHAQKTQRKKHVDPFDFSDLNDLCDNFNLF